MQADATGYTVPYNTSYTFSIYIAVRNSLYDIWETRQ